MERGFKDRALPGALVALPGHVSSAGPCSGSTPTCDCRGDRVVLRSPIPAYWASPQPPWPQARPGLLPGPPSASPPQRERKSSAPSCLQRLTRILQMQVVIQLNLPSTNTY